MAFCTGFTQVVVQNHTPISYVSRETYGAVFQHTAPAQYRCIYSKKVVPALKCFQAQYLWQKLREKKNYYTHYSLLELKTK